MAEKDVFGFDELEKSFKRLEKKYASKADIFLMAQGQATKKKTQEKTPYREERPPNVKGRHLKQSWRLKKVKLYRNDTVRVVRIQSNAPHAHLVEKGHRMVTGGKITIGSGKNRRVLNGAERSERGIKTHKYVKGTLMLSYAIKESGKRFALEGQKMLNELIQSEGFDD